MNVSPPPPPSRETSPAAKSEEKRTFLRAITLRVENGEPKGWVQNEAWNGREKKINRYLLSLITVWTLYCAIKSEKMVTWSKIPFAVDFRWLSKRVKEKHTFTNFHITGEPFLARTKVRTGIVYAIRVITTVAKIQGAFINIYVQK